MISVGSRDDGRKGLSLRYGGTIEGGGDMDLETELEEGEACFQNNNNDDNDNDYDDDDDDDYSTIDPDVALSYLDEKLQDVLGHFQKDFEGGVSAENLGAKFGGYGSFLPSYQRSPACPNPKTPPKPSTNSSSISLNDLFIEGGRQSSVSISNASQSTRHRPVSTSGAPSRQLRGPLMNGKVKQEMHMSSSSKAGDQFTSNGQQPVNNNFANNRSDPKSLKVRIKVGSDNLSTRKKAEIYSGLGLDVSPTSSLEASPVDSNDLCHVPHDTPREESPSSILEMMTSFPVVGGLLLSPLPNDILCLAEKEKWEDSSCGSVHKQSQESTLTVNNSDSKADQNMKKPKPEDSFASVEPINNGNNVMKKEAGINNTSKDVAFKSEPLSVVPKEESLDQVLTHDDFRIKKPYKKDGLVGNASSDEKFISFPTKSDSDVSKGGKFVDIGLIKPLKYEKDGLKLATSSSGGKKKSKGSHSLENGVQSVEVSKISINNDSSKNKRNIYESKLDDPKNNNGKVRKTYKDFFGELDPDLEDRDDMAFEEKPKDYKGTEKGALESNVSSKEILNGKKGPKSSSLVYPVGPGPEPGPHIAAATGNGVPISDAVSATVAAVVNEDWVCCDKCEKWRLLPPGLNPGSLPEKWLCSMLDWLPGMNRCSISQEETTKAITTQFIGPAPTVHGFQLTVHPGAPQSGPMSVDPMHPDQRRQPFGPHTGVKKPKQERPSLSSNSAKKNLHPSNKTISLNGANQSPFVNEVDFQDSGQSSSLIAEKHRLKHKEKKKQHEKFVDEGNNNNALQLKIRNKRETSQDYSRVSKKVKTDDNNGTHKDRVSDQDNPVFKTINTFNNDLPLKKDHLKYEDRSKNSKSNSKSINPKSQNGKRKSNEFDGDQIEGSSETGQRKGKKVKVPESLEEVKGKLLDTSRRDVAVHASLAATSSSSKVSGSHKTKTNNQEIKGSPVESVSSSPLRILNPEKLISSRRNNEGIDNYQSNVFKKELDLVETLEKAEVVPCVEFETQGVKPSFQVHNGEKRNDDQSHSRSRKNGKGSSSRSKEKNRSFKSDNDKINLKISERMTENSDFQEKSKGGRNRSQEKPFVNPDKYEKGPALKKESSGKPISVPDVKQKVSIERDSEKNSKQGKPHSLPLPPSGKGQNGQNDSSRPPQPLVGSQKENTGNSLLIDSVEVGDALKAVKQKKKAENQNGNHLTPNRHKGTPSPLRRESSSQTASAIKEAKALKHLADRLKNSGSNHESNSLYFQAALKFLYGSCLLESSYTESGKHSDMIQSMDMYSSTAKLCEYVAHEYEKSKEMAAAALAYKLAEVAYLKVVYSSHTNASKDRQELQTTLTGPTGESPSSSASDIDNLNNPTAVDKAPIPKGVNDPQIGGNHVISARNKANFLRILNFAQNVNFAMEASRRSQMAFAASGSQLEHAHLKVVIKPALDFNFQDIEGLLQLVRVAMEVISK